MIRHGNRYAIGRVETYIRQEKEFRSYFRSPIKTEKTRKSTNFLFFYFRGDGVRALLQIRKCCVQRMILLDRLPRRWGKLVWLNSRF